MNFIERKKEIEKDFLKFHAHKIKDANDFLITAWNNAHDYISFYKDLRNDNISSFHIYENGISKIETFNDAISKTIEDETIQKYEKLFLDCYQSQCENPDYND
jgi:hypothetical protein